MKSLRALSWFRKGLDEAGQTMVEYAIVAALIAVAAMGAVEALGGGISTLFENIVESITAV